MFTTQYEYDARGRCTKKKLPGADFVEYTYNDADQLVYSQDGNQRAQATKKWTYYLYDKFGRLTEQGECTNKSATSSPVVYIHNYYDGYGFINGTGFTDSNYKLTEAQKAYGKGYQTGSVISIFGDSKKIYLMYQYDIQGRVVKTVQNNLLDGLDVTETTYTFSSNPQTVVHKNTYKENGTQKSITETYIYTYDYADRISKVEHTLNDTKVVLSENTYNKLGQLVNRSLHGASADIMGYAYNIRNWLTRIESPNLILKLNYGYSAGGGNIASMFWKSGEEGRQKYTFTYDGLGRMLNADHLILGQQDEDDDDWGVTTGLMSIQTGRQIEETPLARENAFTERVTEYDKNGNILKLVRYGQTGANSYGVIDNLTMTLTGNQLNRVDDASTASAYGGGFEFKDAVKQDNEYAYDANGNLTQDLNKGIEDIQYNCLNLPRLVKFKDQSTITYTYAADGTKLRVEHKIGNSTTRTTYCSNVIYEDGTAKCLLTEEGYVSLDDREYHYYLKDHQGNNRVLVNKNGGVEEINHYYPFGGVFASEENVQPYKYNGKELDTKKGLNWYDYGARRYDAALGRFTTTDRFAEKYYSMSSYQYGGNNPVGNIDVNGDSIVISPNPNGLIDHIKSRFGYDTKFQKTVKADLAQLKKDDKTVAQIILKLEDSENIHQITMVEDRRKGNLTEVDKEKAAKGISQGTTVRYDPYTQIEPSGEKRTPRVGLSHELQHSYDADQGTITREITVNGVLLIEVRAINTENKIRMKTGDPKRTKYGRREVPKTLLE